MEMTRGERAALARRIAAARIERFKGSRKAAYTAAGINSATWTRLEKGETVKEQTVVAALQTLWPETGGDWRKMDPPLAASVDLVELVRSSMIPEGAKAELLQMLAERERTNDGDGAGEAKGA